MQFAVEALLTKAGCVDGQVRELQELKPVVPMRLLPNAIIFVDRPCRENRQLPAVYLHEELKSMIELWSPSWYRITHPGRRYTSDLMDITPELFPQTFP